MRGEPQAGEARGLRRVRGLLETAARLFPLRPLGLLVAAVGAAALRYYAYGELDLVLLVLGYVALACVAASLVVVLPAALALRLLRGSLEGAVAGDGTASRELETGRSVPLGFSLPRLGFVPLLQVRLAWIRPEGAEVWLEQWEGRRRERVRLSRRGEHAGVVRRLVVQDAFGLARVAFDLRDDRSLRVLPHLGGLLAMPFLATLSAGDRVGHPFGLPEGDLIELRRYAPGDPARLIHWKVFGRTRKLMIRAPERALSEALRTVAYLITGPGDEASAAAARAAVLSGALGAGFRFAADGAPPTGDPDGAVAAIVASAAYRGEPGASLERVVAEAEREGPVSLVVFAPPSPGPWVARVLSAAIRRPGRVRVVVGIDGLARPPRWPRVARLLVRRPASGAAVAAELTEVAQRLGAARVDVQVVDRPSGRVLSAAHLAAARPELERARAA